MLVIVRCAGGKLAVPVIGQAHGAKLCSHGGDILGRPVARMHATLHRRVFCRQPERIPSHRVKDIISAGAAVARHHVAKRVVADMPHMYASRRVGKHLENVIFRLFGSGFRDETSVGVPALLPFGLDGGRVVLIHESHPGGMP